MATGRLLMITDENQTKYVMQEHSKKVASGCKCNVTSCTDECDCPDGFRYQLVKLHGQCNGLHSHYEITRSLAYSLRVTHPYTHTHSLRVTHPYTHTHTHTHTNTHIHTHTHMYTHTHTCTCHTHHAHMHTTTTTTTTNE